MFGLTPLPLYLVIFLAFSNLATVVLWRVADARADRAQAETIVVAAKHDAFVAQTRADGERAARRTAEIIANSVTVTEDIKHDYQAALTRLRADYQRLRQRPADGAAGGGVPAVPGATGGTDAIPADAVPLAAACAETTLNLVALQRWAQQQKELAP